MNQIWVRVFLMFLTPFFILSCLSSMKRNPNSEEPSRQARHVIFTVHGISGDKTTWGSFEETTIKYLSEIDPHFKVEVYNFEYPTGVSEKKDTFEFANMFGSFIESKFKSTPITDDDKISIVAHSQGGIVSYIWFMSRILKLDAQVKYAQKVDSLITLGTPFWGSKLATIASDKELVDILPLAKMFAGDQFKMTRKELLDMSFGSPTINNFRNIAIQFDSIPDMSERLKKFNARHLNVVGILPGEKGKVFKGAINSQGLAGKVINFIYSIYTKSGFGGQRIESDIAVIAPSARWDFIYSNPVQVKNANVTIAENDFKHFSNMVDRSKVFYVETVHLPFGLDNSYSMAFINKDCVQDLVGCHHPTYGYILNHLAHCEKENCNAEKVESDLAALKSKNLKQYEDNKRIKDELEAFSIQLSLKLKRGYLGQLNVKYQKSKILSDFPESTVWYLNNNAVIGDLIRFQSDDQDLVIKNDLYSVQLADRNEFRSVDVTSKEYCLSSETFKVETSEECQSDTYDHLRVNLTGNFRMQNKNKRREYFNRIKAGVSIPLEIRLPQLPAVHVDVKIQPGMSTYSEIDFSESKAL